MKQFKKQTALTNIWKVFKSIFFYILFYARLNNK